MDHTAELETPRILAGWQGRGRRLLFAALLAAGFLVWEATAMPAVAALVVCFKFGFGDWSLGVWLARHDPDRKRGLVCLLFHLAFGMWKVAVSATLLVFLSLFAGVIMARAGQQPMLPGLGPILSGAVGAALAGYGLTLLTTYVAIVFGVWMRVRMWLGESQWLARSGRYWPPRQSGRNMAPLLSMTTLVLSLWLGVVLGVGILVSLNPLAGMPLALCLVLCIVLLAVFVAVFQAISRRAFARCVADCWPHRDGEVVHQELPETRQDPYPAHVPLGGEC